MRALGTLVVAVVASWLVAGFIQVGIGIEFDAREALILAFMVEIVFAVFVGLVFGAVLAARGGRRGISFAAIAIVFLGVVSLAALEAFALADAAGTIDPSDLPLMIELGLPALVTVIIQWWLVRAYLRRRTAPVAAAVPAQG